MVKVVSACGNQKAKSGGMGRVLILLSTKRQSPRRGGERGSAVGAVEENPIGERTDGPVTELAEKPELAGHSEGGGEERAPLLYVRGQRWSPGVYCSMRLLGQSIEVAWERAFIALPTF